MCVDILCLWSGLGRERIYFKRIFLSREIWVFQCFGQKGRNFQQNLKIFFNFLKYLKLTFFNTFHYISIFALFKHSLDTFDHSSNWKLIQLWYHNTHHQLPIKWAVFNTNSTRDYQRFYRHTQNSLHHIYVLCKTFHSIQRHRVK